MKRLIILFLIIIAALASYSQEPLDGNKATICHKPGTPSQETMTVVDTSAAQGHIQHGDVYGTCEVLPVELIDFSGTYDKNKIRLIWTTASETNNDYFLIEQSKDGFNFNPLGTIKGAGTISQTRVYNFTDNMPNIGVNYYRIRQVDFDGKFEYSNIISVDTDIKDYILILIKYKRINVVSTKLIQRVDVFDIKGKLIISSEENSINTSYLKPGYYFLKAFHNNKQIFTHKFIVPNEMIGGKVLDYIKEDTSYPEKEMIYKKKFKLD